MIRSSNAFILPFIVNCVLDVYICYQICHQRTRLTVTSPSSRPIKRKFRRAKKSLAHEITLTLLCQSMWLLLTYFPIYLYYFLLSFGLIDGADRSYDRDNSTLNVVMRISLLVYLAFSPTLYVILSPTLRREIYSHMRRTYRQHRTKSSSNEQNKSRQCSEYWPPLNQRSSPASHADILLTTNERLPTRIVLKAVSIPKRLHRESISMPCFRLDEQSRQLIRSNTLCD